MRSFFQWIKNHKTIVFLIIIIAYLVLKNNNRIYPSFFPSMTNSIDSMSLSESTAGESRLEKTVGSSSEEILPLPDYTPTSNNSNRMIVQNSSLSLLVTDVSGTQQTIIQKTVELGGYMVNSYLTRPQDAPNAIITLRIPAQNMDMALATFRQIAVKVISENLQGEDVTDQYVDSEARLLTLTKTKEKFESIMDQAVKVQDILEVQRELINLQSQIDALKGQQNYLEKNAQMAKMTIYISTDELALPYAPSESWRPNVIFKEAVRSLIGAFRKIGTIIIWLGVYAIIWIPVGIVAFLFHKRKRKNYNKKDFSN